MTHLLVPIGKVLVAAAAVLAAFVLYCATARRIERRRTPVPAIQSYNACPELLRLRNDHIEAELRLLGRELRVHPDLHLETLDGLFTNRPHATDN